MEWLTIVYKRHREWINIVKFFGYCTSPEDIVQDMYVQLTKEIPLRKITDKRVNPDYIGLTSEERAINSDGKVNTAYIWIMLRKCYDANYKESKEAITTNIGVDFLFAQTEECADKEQAYDRYREKLESEIASWSDYDANMFMDYMDDDVSLRSLSEESAIPLSSVVNTLNNCKERLIENVREDYEDFINGDYELIK